MPYMLVWAPYSVLLLLAACWFNRNGRELLSYVLAFIGVALLLTAFFKDHDSSMLRTAVEAFQRVIALWRDDLLDRALNLLRDLAAAGS